MLYLIRQHARLDDPALHSVTPLGTKYAVYDYYDEIEQSLKAVVNGYIARCEYAEVWVLCGFLYDASEGGHKRGSSGTG